MEGPWCPAPHLLLCDAAAAVVSVHLLYSVYVFLASNVHRSYRWVVEFISWSEEHLLKTFNSILSISSALQVPFGHGVCQRHDCQTVQRRAAASVERAVQAWPQHWQVRLGTSQRDLLSSSYRENVILHVTMYYMCVFVGFVSGKRHGRIQALCFWITTSMRRTSAFPPTGRSSWKSLMVLCAFLFSVFKCVWIDWL